MRFIFAFLCLSFFAVAKDKGIAVVNYQKLEEKSTVMQSVLDQIKDKQQKLQKDVVKIQKRIQKKVEDLEKSASVLSAKALQVKKLNLQKELVQTDENLKNEGARLENIKNQTMLEINKHIKDVVHAVAKSKGYDLVISEVATVYYHQKYDITDIVIKEFDKQKPIKINWDKK